MTGYDTIIIKMSTPERSRGEKIHRRRDMAEERKKTPPVPPVRKAGEAESLEVRLINIEVVLSPTNLALKELKPQRIAEMEFERIWLLAKVEGMRDAERQSLLQKELNRWEEKNPEVFKHLTTVNGNGLTPLARIRDSVIPPRLVSGYYTKK